MGDDFIVKEKDRYNRSLTKTVEGYHRQPTLFRLRVKETVSYPCQLNEGAQLPSIGRRLTLRLVQDSVEILDEYKVLGCISPEASQDVIDDFRANPECKGILTVDVASVFEETKRIDVMPSSASTNGAN
jgi:hypothetical protein